MSEKTDSIVEMTAEMTRAGRDVDTIKAAVAAAEKMFQRWVTHSEVVLPAPPTSEPAPQPADLGAGDDRNESSRRCTAAVDALARVVAEKHPKGISATSGELLRIAGVQGITPNGFTRRLLRVASGKRSHPLVTVAPAGPRRENQTTFWRVTLRTTANA